MRRVARTIADLDSDRDADAAIDLEDVAMASRLRQLPDALSSE
jgi:hypothetical protein